MALVGVGAGRVCTNSLPSRDTENLLSWDLGVSGVSFPSPVEARSGLLLLWSPSPELAEGNLTLMDVRLVLLTLFCSLRLDSGLSDIFLGQEDLNTSNKKKHLFEGSSFIIKTVGKNCPEGLRGYTIPMHSK